MGEATTLYKVLVDGTSCHGGEHVWSLPTPDGAGGWVPGAWTPEVADPVLCKRGWHLTTAPYAWWAVWGMTVYEAEAEGIADRADDKLVCRRARLLRPAPVPAWWAACERFVRDEIPAVPWFRPDGDPDPAWRLVTAPTWGAARDAAWDAARGAAWDAAGDAAWGAARGAAWDAAGDAAWDAAWGAAGGAARGAARGAAWDAAGDAAGDAALCCGVERLDADLPIADEHRAYARAAWRAWEKGYAVLGDVDGHLVVYAATGGPVAPTYRALKAAVGEGDETR